LSRTPFEDEKRSDYTSRAAAPTYWADWQGDTTDSLAQIVYQFVIEVWAMIRPQRFGDDVGRTGPDIVAQRVIGSVLSLIITFYLLERQLVSFTMIWIR